MHKERKMPEKQKSKTVITKNITDFPEA